MEFFNMNESKFETLEDELRDAFAKLLNVPKTSIQIALAKDLVKRSIGEEKSIESMVLLVTIATNALEDAKKIENNMNLETFVQEVNDEINDSEMLKNSGITLERVSTAKTNVENGTFTY